MIGLVRLIARNRLALVGLVVLVALVVLSLVTPLLPLANPDVIDTARRFRLPSCPTPLRWDLACARHQC